MASKDWNGTFGSRGAEDSTAVNRDDAAGLASARRLLDGVIRYVKRARLRAETARALGSLDERTLKDIGVHPHDATWLGARMIRAGNDNWRAAGNDNAPMKDGTRSAS